MSGSIIVLTSFTSWLTLEPTSPAPIRITILFGALFCPGFPAAAEVSARKCVRFFCLLLAMVSELCVTKGELTISSVDQSSTLTFLQQLFLMPRNFSRVTLKGIHQSPARIGAGSIFARRQNFVQGGEGIIGELSRGKSCDGDIDPSHSRRHRIHWRLISYNHARPQEEKAQP